MCCISTPRSVKFVPFFIVPFLYILNVSRMYDRGVLRMFRDVRQYETACITRSSHHSLVTTLGARGIHVKVTSTRSVLIMGSGLSSSMLGFTYRLIKCRKGSCRARARTVVPCFVSDIECPTSTSKSFRVKGLALLVRTLNSLLLDTGRTATTGFTLLSCAR